MEEIWKDIQGYEGLYQISNLGNVKTLHYGQKVHNHNWESTPSRLLKQKTSTSGYQRVELYKKDSRKCFYVHRLVAIAFLENPENKPQINHKDGNKFNNCIDNLEWATSSENLKHAHQTGLKPSSMKGVTGHKSHKARTILQYDLNGNFVNIWYSMVEAANSLGTRSTTISSCVRGKHKTSYGYIWRYFEGDYIPMKIDV